jgi:membrane carboxypeptidase/penicillin-binding protein PbpC
MRLGQDYVQRAGLRVVTTLDLNLQERAQQIVAEHVARLQPEHDLNNAALVALKPPTAEILVMVGSADFNDNAIAGQVNVAISPRQPGSAIKPLLYVAALDDNAISPATVLWDLPVQYQQANGQVYQPHNYDNQFHGPLTVRTALANSYNVPAVKLLALYGIERMVERLRRMGISTLTQENGWYGLSLALGGSEVTLLDLTTAYHILANGGSYAAPKAVLTLVDGQGQAEAPARETRGAPVLSPPAAFLVTDILSDNTARAPAFGADSPLNLSRPAAVKTGTTNDLRDNWTIGYTRFLVAGVWAGNSDGRPMQGATGLSGAAPIWQAFMEAAMADPALLAVVDASADPAAWQFQPPPGVEQLGQCPPLLACRQGGEYFTDAWLEQTAGEPLRDSAVYGAFASVYSEGEGLRRQIGYCGEPFTAASGGQSILRLPGRIGSSGEDAPSGDDLPVEQAAALQNFAAAQLEQEQGLALAWSIDAGVPLHLGACEGLEQRVAALLPGEGRPQQRIWVEQAAANAP